MSRIAVPPTLFTMLDDLQRRLAALEGLAGGSTSVGAPAFSYGVSNILGNSDVATAIDSTLAIFDDLNITTSLPGDRPAAGAVAFAPRRDHHHGREQPSGIFNVLDYGALADCVVVADASVTLGQQTVHSTLANFSNADVNKIIAVVGPGAHDPSNGYHPFVGRITSVASGVAMTDAPMATNTVTGAVCAFGTDNSLALAAALADVQAVGATLFFPSGAFASSTGLHITADNVVVAGVSMQNSALYRISSEQVSDPYIISHDTVDRGRVRDLRVGWVPVDGRYGPSFAASVLGKTVSNYVMERVECLVPSATWGAANCGVQILAPATSGPVRISNCVFQGCVGGSILLAGVNQVIIEGNQSFDSGDDHISVGGAVSDCLVRGNYLDRGNNGGIAIYGGGVSPPSNGPVTRASMIGNVVRNTNSAGLGVFGDSATHSPTVESVEFVVLNGNMVDSGNGHQPVPYYGIAGNVMFYTGWNGSVGIHVAHRNNTALLHDILVTGNIVSNVLQSFIACTGTDPSGPATNGAISRVSIVANHLYFAAAAMPAGSTVSPLESLGNPLNGPGIFVDYVRNALVAENGVHYSNHEGILIGAGCLDPAQVIGNQVAHAGQQTYSGQASTAAIALKVPVGNHAIVNGNIIQDSGAPITSSIDLNNNGQVTCIGNFCFDGNPSITGVSGGSNGNTIVANNSGYNPAGAVTTPASGASGSTHTNNTGVPVTVAFTATVTACKINGIATFTSGSVVNPNYLLMPGGTIQASWSSFTNWTWIGQ